MKQKTLVLCTVFLLGLGLPGLQAQEAVLAAGGEALGSGGTASYSVGQVVYTTNTGTNGSVSQGVQQPFEISVVTGIPEAEGINLSISVYPNPTTDFLTLSADNFEISNLSYHLYDMQGKLLETKKLEGNQTSISMSRLVPASYFLKIVQTLHARSQQEIKTFKIIKTR